MKRKPKRKLSPIERRLEHHDRLCTRFIYSDPDRMKKCSCGRDAAIEEYRALLKLAKLNQLTFGV